MDRDHEALVELAMHSLDSAAEMGAASSALVHLLDVASALNIEVAVFKGVAIATQWYEDPGRRPAADVDVFVNPGDIEQLPALIGAFADRPEAADAVRAMIGEGRVFEYSLLVDGGTIDVHLDPMNLLVPTQQARIMWERTTMVTLADGHTVRTLDLELSVIQLLLNLFRDSFADLLHFHDLDLMLNNEPDWDFIESFVEVEGWTDIVRYALAVGCDVLGRTSPLPRAIARGNRIAIERIWPREVRMAGSDSLAQSQRRQSLVSLLIEHRRRDVALSLAGGACSLHAASSMIASPTVPAPTRSPCCAGGSHSVRRTSAALKL